jgi:predicted DNA-binding transcriptional regulator AlpA
MPARKHRTGADLAEWEARKAANAERMEFARMRAQTLSGHALLRPIEVAGMLGGVTLKTLREMEHRGELPPRVTFSSKVFGWRLADIEAMIDARASGTGRDAAA